MEGDSAGKIFTTAPPHHQSLTELKVWLDKANSNFPRFFIVSHQAGDRIDWTDRWLSEHGLNGKIPAYYTYDKVGAMTRLIQEVSQSVGIVIHPFQAILLDDSPRELDLARQAGINVICIDQSWNQMWVGDRISHLGEFNPFVVQAQM
jgi:hypothetical protein